MVNEYRVVVLFMSCTGRRINKTSPERTEKCNVTVYHLRCMSLTILRHEDVRAALTQRLVLAGVSGLGEEYWRKNECIYSAQSSTSAMGYSYDSWVVPGSFLLVVISTGSLA